LSVLPLAVIVAFVLGCGDDSTETDTGGGGEADTGADASEDMSGDAGGGDATGETSDDLIEEIIERATCGVIEAVDETALYDVLSPIQDFVGLAVIEKSGLDLHVEIPDEDNPEREPDVFDGVFNEGESCVSVSIESFNADLCFYAPDGTPAAPEALGSQLFAFIAGVPHDRPNANLIGGIRRDIERPCTAGGFFPLDNDDVSQTEGNLPTEAVEFAIEEYLGYLAIFDGGEERFNFAVGRVPVVDALDPDGSPLRGHILATVSQGFLLDIDESETEWDADITIDAMLNLETGVLEGTATIELEGVIGGEVGVVSGSISGTRN
jgi:hypothetical protein